MTAGDGHDGVGGRDSADRRDQAGSLVSPPGDLWWHAVFEASRDAIFISDGDSRFVAVNEAACLLTGYSRDELLRMRIPDLHDEVDLEAYRTHHSRIMTGEEALTRAAVRCRDGRKVEAEFSNRALTIDGHLFMHTVARDIGDRLAVERALQETTANLEALVENTDCAIWSVDADLRLVAGNSIFRDSVRRNLGRDLVPGESVLLEALSPDTRALWHALLSRALGGESFATELPTELQADLQVAEYRFSPIREASGKVTGATVFRRDVTERVRAEDALRLSEARFRDLVENLNEVVYIVQEDGAFTYLSPVIHGILGYEPEDLLGVPYTDLVHPDDVDRIRSDFALVLAGSPYVQEYRLRHRDGSYRWVRASSRSVVAEDGAVRVQGAAIDVTEWKREEEARRRTEEAFRTALENVTMVVVMLDVQGRVGFINDFALDLAGRTRDEALGGDWFELFIPAPSRDELRATFADTFSSGSFPAHYESPIVTRSGEERMVEWSNTVLRDPAGHVTRTVSFGEDVTERRRAVGALRKSEAHLTRAQELAHVGSWSFSPETGQPWWSREMFSIFGLDPGDGPPTYEQHRRLIHPDDWERFDAAVQLSLAQAVGYDLELRIVRPDGEERIVRSICAARTIGTGPPYALDGATQDISERKGTELQLRSVNTFLDTIIDQSPFAMWIAGRDGTVIRTNQALRATLGLPDSEVVGRYNVLEDANLERQGVIDAVRAVFETFEPARFSILWEAASSGLGSAGVRALDIDAALFPIVGDNRALTHVVCQWVDVTDRVRAEHALRASEERYRMLFSAMAEGFALHEILCDEAGVPVDYRFLDANPAFYELTGLSDRILGHLASEILPDLEPLWIERYGRVALEGEPVRFEAESGPLGRHYEVRAFAPRPKWFATVFLDVTERSRAVAALRESEARLARAQRIARIGSWTFDPVAGRVTWSHETYRIFGRDPGKDPPGYDEHRAIILPADWPRFDAAVRAAVEHGRRYELELRIVRPDGEVRHANVIGSVMGFDESGAKRIEGTVQDVTERKRAEEERLRLMREVRTLGARLVAAEDAERKRLAHELHDRVGQGLTALGLTLDLVRSTLPRDAAAEVGPRLEAAAALVGQTMAQVRDVMGALRPPMLDEYGLVPTLEWWSEQFGQRTGIGVEVRGAEPSPRLGIDVELPVFRVVQEALTNVARHSGAAAATVTVAQGATAVTVEIADRGRGFDGARLAETGSGKSWGMAIMRERAFAVGAELAVDARPGHGTRVLVTVPR